MKLTENTKVKIRVPKHLYEAIQAELHKKHMEEGEYGHEENMEEADMPTTGAEMAAKAIGGDYTFEYGMGLVLAIAGGVALASSIKDPKKLIQTAKDKLIGWWKGAKADLTPEETKELVSAAEKAKVQLPGVPSAEPVSEASREGVYDDFQYDNLEEAFDLITLMEAVKDLSKKKAEDKKKKELEAKKKKAEDDKKKKEAEAKKKAATKKKAVNEIFGLGGSKTTFKKGDQVMDKEDQSYWYVKATNVDGDPKLYSLTAQGTRDPKRQDVKRTENSLTKTSK